MHIDMTDFRGFDGALMLGIMVIFAPVWLPVWLVGATVRAIIKFAAYTK